MRESSRVSVGADLRDSFGPALLPAHSDAASWPIRILIVDDHKMFAEGIARQLGAETDLQIVGCAFSAREGIRKAESTRPHVAIVDCTLSDSDGCGAIELLAVNPSIRVLMLTGPQDERLVVSAIDAGCSGFLTKHADTAELIAAIRQLAAGESYIPSHLLSLLLPRLGTNHRDLGKDLSSREREVLELLATGAPTTKIADQLFVSVTTVRNHVQRILVKLSAHSKLEAVAIAVREGVIAQPH
jgi:DNA-binding NarL/FixJ family response regulator